MSLSDQLLIWDSSDDIDSKYDAVALWQSYKLSSDKNEVSIPQLVEDNSDHLRSKYLRLIYDLGEAEFKGKRVIDHLEILPNFSYWWMTLISEKCNYAKSQQINDMIKMIAFEEWFEKNNYQTVTLASSNRQLADAIYQMTNSLKIEFKWQKKTQHHKKGFLKSLYHSSPYFIQSLVWMVFYLTSHWKLKGTGVYDWKKSEAKVTFVSYLVNLNKESLSKGVFASNYWTDLLLLLEKQKIKSNWLHLYVKNDLLPTATSARNIIKRFNKKHDGAQVHVTLDSFLSIRLVFLVLKDWYRILRLSTIVSVPLRRKSGLYWSFFEKDYLSSMIGSTLMSNLFFLHLSNEAMSQLPSQNRGFYLKENQSWEFGFIHAWRTANHGDNLTGIPHTTVIYWDLRYFFDPRSYEQKGNCTLPLPNKVGVNGKAAKNIYLEGGYPKEWLVEVEALRYLYLFNANNKKDKTMEGDKDKITLLILTDYLEENVEQQMNLIHDIPLSNNIGIRCLIKPHPACSVPFKTYSVPNVEITNAQISTLLGNCSLVFTSNVTSAAVDAYCMGIPIITMLNPKGLNLSPLRGYEGVSFISSSKELADCLDKINQLKIVEKQGKEYFHLNPQLPRWKRILEIAE